jgi:hypothetical protein
MNSSIAAAIMASRRSAARAARLEGGSGTGDSFPGEAAPLPRRLAGFEAAVWVDFADAFAISVI